jgi:hypothetical protein
MSIFKNAQWEVTDRGMVSLASGPARPHEIGASRLLQKIGAGVGKFYDLPLLMIEKPWVDPELFFEAYREACEAHAKATLDSELLEDTIGEARRILEHSEGAAPQR